jgi:hypothetical protein
MIQDGSMRQKRKERRNKNRKSLVRRKGRKARKNESRNKGRLAVGW